MSSLPAFLDAAEEALLSAWVAQETRQVRVSVLLMEECQEYLQHALDLDPGMAFPAWNDVRYELVRMARALLTPA
jgi:hypothetical protein